MKKFKAGNTVKILKITQGYDGKFKVGDTGVVDRFQYDDSEYLVLIGDISNENCDDCWHDVDNIELAEDTSKPVTVTHEGNVYEIGKPYLFSDGGNYWHLLKLKRVVVGGPLPFEVWLTASKSTVFSLIKEVPASGYLGTITPAPIELIDGNAYMFDEKIPYSNKDCIGIYENHKHKFHLKNYSVFVESCTNIRPMTVAESK
jgi:hypothetical protein